MTSLSPFFSSFASSQPRTRCFSQPEPNKHRSSYEARQIHAGVHRGVATAIATLASATVAQAQTTLPEVQVIEFRGEQVDSIKYSRDLQDTPRIITILTQDLLQEQGVSTLNDALKNQPGISLQAGEGNPPAGDQLKIRGFNARDDINVNSTRDLGNYYRDPFYVDQLEIIKGPNSAFSGRGSAGGTINFVTKKPLPETATRTNDGARLEVSVGTDKYKRTTLDLNKPIDLNSAVRINLMAHGADIPGRDIAKESRQGLYAAYTWGFIGPTKFTVDYLHLRQRDLPDAGLPFDREGYTSPDGTTVTSTQNPGDRRPGDGFRTGKLPPNIRFSNFYGHLDDYKHVDVNQLGLSVEHAMDNGMMLRNQTRLSQVTNDSITSSPRIKIRGNTQGTGNWSVPCNAGATEGVCVQGDTKPRDQKDQGFNNQTDLLFNFKTGAVEHDMVVGLELANYTFENRRRIDGNGPRTSLYNPAGRVGPATHNYGGIHRFETTETGVYVLDTMTLSPQWELHAGIRWDRVKAKASERDRENGTSTHGDYKKENATHTKTDNVVSYSLGLVHKLEPNTSIYASYGTAFVTAGNFDRNGVQLAGGNDSRVVTERVFNSDPEKMTSYEAGIKRKVGDGLDLNAAVFRTDTKRGRSTAAGAGDITVLDVEWHVNGIELLLAGNITNRLRMYGGYVYMDSKVTKSPSRPFMVGQKLGGTPEHSFNLFATYDLTSQFTLGGGIQYVSSQIDSIQDRDPDTVRRRNVSIPGYTVADLYAAYNFNPKTQVRLNLNNVFDKKYIAQMADGGAQGIPGKGRQLIATLRHDF